MIQQHHLSGEAFEQLHTWLRVHCVCALENPDFLPGLIVIVEMEVDRAVQAACWKALRNISKPCQQ